MLRRFASAFRPALPASIGANLVLTAGDDVQASAVSYDADTLARYDAVRGNVGAAISEAFLGARSPAAVARISRAARRPSPTAADDPARDQPPEAA